MSLLPFRENTNTIIAHFERIAASTESSSSLIEDALLEHFNNRTPQAGDYSVDYVADKVLDDLIEYLSARGITFVRALMPRMPMHGNPPFTTYQTFIERLQQCFRDEGPMTCYAALVKALLDYQALVPSTPALRGPIFTAMPSGMGSTGHPGMQQQNQLQQRIQQLQHQVQQLREHQQLQQPPEHLASEPDAPLNARAPTSAGTPGATAWSSAVSDSDTQVELSDDEST